MSIRWFAIALACIAAFATAAPAQETRPTKGNTETQGPSSDMTAYVPPGTKLPGSFVYVYSFLDLRGDVLGDDLMSDMQDTLGASLRAAGIDNKVLPSKRNPEMGFTEDYEGNKNVGVAAAIKANAADEAATKARFRLIAFPANVTEMEYPAMQVFDIEWKLVDIRTDREIWSLTTHDKHSYVGLTGSKSRAKSTIKRVMAGLASAGLL